MVAEPLGLEPPNEAQEGVRRLRRQPLPDPLDPPGELLPDAVDLLDHDGETEGRDINPLDRAVAGIRTRDLRLTKASLYQAEPQRRTAAQETCRYSFSVGTASHA